MQTKTECSWPSFKGSSGCYPKEVNHGGLIHSLRAPGLPRAAVPVGDRGELRPGKGELECFCGEQSEEMCGEPADFRNQKEREVRLEGDQADIMEEKRKGWNKVSWVVLGT